MDSWAELENKPEVKSIRIGEVELKPGDQVILRPLRGSDVMDIVLAGKTATIESIMQDYEDRVYVVIRNRPSANLTAVICTLPDTA